MNKVTMFFDFLEDRLSFMLILLAPLIYLVKVYITRNSKGIEIRTKVFYEKKFEKIQDLNASVKEYQQDMQYLIGLIDKGALLPIGLKMVDEKLTSLFFSIRKIIFELEFYCSDSENTFLRRSQVTIEDIQRAKANVLVGVNYHDASQEIKINKPLKVLELKRHIHILDSDIHSFLEYNYKLYSK